MYDLADNLLGERSPQSDIDAHLPLAPIADNRLTHWQKLFYRYDAWGNLISRRNGLYEQHYRYDADNRLVQAHGRGPQGEFEAQYHYDALGRRSRKAVRYKGKTEQTTRFLWQGYRLLQEQRDDGSRRSWSYDPASPWSPLAALEQAGDSRSADIYWYHTDLNSAPLEVTDAAGNLCWSGQYDTFGKLQGQTVAGAAKRQGAQYQQPLRYAGQYQDDESGLHYNLFRYYEPEVGRFTTQDPIGLEGGLNLYQYAPNPLNWIDPLGLSKCEPEKWDVNSHQGNKNAVKGKNLGLDSHHVGQKNIMKDLVEGYDPATAPAMLVPRVGHTVSKEGVGIVSRSKINPSTGLPFTNARDVVARDIRELRRVYPEIPNSKLRELIDLNKKMYPELRARGIYE